MALYRTIFSISSTQDFFSITVLYYDVWRYNLMDAAAEIGRNPVSKHQIQPEYGDEQADAGRDCRIRLARPNSQARKRTGEYSFSLFS